MKTKILLYSIILLSFLFQGCSGPKNLVKLNPNEETTKWVYGQEFAKDSIYGIIYEVAFDEFAEPNYIFDFDITNRSNLSILIDPKDFYYLPLNHDFYPIITDSVYASDPESEILQLEKGIAKTESRKKNHFALSLMAIGVDIAAAAITASNDNPHDDFIRTDLFNAVQADKVANEFESQSLKELRDSWSNSTIRKTTLEPTYSIQGKAIFPANTEAEFIEMHFPVDDQEVIIRFKQNLIPIK